MAGGGRGGGGGLHVRGRGLTMEGFGSRVWC